MTQTEFNEKFNVAMAEYRKSLQDNDCGEWSAKAREWAIQVGLFAGNGTTVDGQPNMMWADPLTREQAAVRFIASQKNTVWPDGNRQEGGSYKKPLSCLAGTARLY